MIDLPIDGGTVVRFKGGLGRGEHADPSTIYTGVVNGPTTFTGGGAYVPVHVREINHNLIVASTNIVEIVRPDDAA
jgi:hypothetical protein